jgi:CRISPR-associated endoribonuclease Cas6
MPHRLHFTFRGDPPEQPFQHAAGLRALALRWISEADPELGASLHSSGRPKPYTLSPLWSPRGEPGVVRWEVTVLTDWLLEPLEAGVRKCGPEVRLGPQRFELERWERGRGVAWHGLLDGPPASDWTLRLHSPTAHHATGPFRKSVVLPTPELYWGSWYQRWNLYAPPELRMEDSFLLETVAERIAVSGCAGQTETVPLDAGRAFLGFTGEVRFTLLQPKETAPELRAALTALARLAPYCGTGVETMRGMGQTELL